VRQAAALALEKLPDPQKIDQLIRKLRDPDPSLRVEAAQGLGKMGDERAIEPLLRLLSDAFEVKQEKREWPVVRGSPSWQMVETITRHHTDYPVRQAAAKALQAISTRMADRSEKRVVQTKLRQTQLSEDHSSSEVSSGPACYCDAH
jgi:HEAT repeat protein